MRKSKIKQDFVFGELFQTVILPQQTSRNHNRRSDYKQYRTIVNDFFVVFQVNFNLNYRLFKHWDKSVSFNKLHMVWIFSCFDCANRRLNRKLAYR